ncbi:50S ribosomal protein L29 [[Mycoplasma] falconis]|uniref:Large ribosomal subunit protein uL29 n=1 Tax=[Mycoplasma] falconis TaxID=92403 RepID=A0A501XBS6_9BACT|nr:50S ribosomal protein L29 [[Mycoplasma] falconis]TPE58011.1 50S ribosomal protein L29 [[Mycoplasma] falconis]
MSYQELVKKSIKELKEQLAELKAELFSLRFKNATRQLQSTHKIDSVKKDIARVLTAINKKQAEGEQE